jgi:hypothetical protein
MEQFLSACGLLCGKCNFFKNSCNGCFSVKGSTFWAKEMMPNKTCPLYQCSINDKKYRNCGQCKELPCKTFNEFKDPNASEEEHKKSLKERINRLKSS